VSVRADLVPDDIESGVVAAALLVTLMGLILVVFRRRAQ